MITEEVLQAGGHRTVLFLEQYRRSAAACVKPVCAGLAMPKIATKGRPTNNKTNANFPILLSFKINASCPCSSICPAFQASTQANPHDHYSQYWQYYPQPVQPSIRPQHQNSSTSDEQSPNYPLQQS